jgi:hypothetical protein
MTLHGNTAIPTVRVSPLTDRKHCFSCAISIFATKFQEQGDAPDRHLLKFNFEATKTFLGAKDMYGYLLDVSSLDCPKTCD